MNVSGPVLMHTEYVGPIIDACNSLTTLSTIKKRLHQGNMLSEQHVAGNKIVSSLLPVCW